MSRIAPAPDADPDAALAGAGAPVFMVWLNIRCSRIVRAVRHGLAAAGHR